MTIAAYVRVSSKAQDHASQRDAITRAAPGIDLFYSEKLSGKTTDRPELKRLMADIRQGKVRDVWVFKLDRLTRSGVADTYRLVDEIRKSGATLHAVADNLVIRPGEDIVSDTMIFALSLAAKLERTAINDRIAAARTRLEAAGEAWGRPPRMGDAERSKAREMAAAGASVSAISMALGIPRATVGRAVKRTGQSA